MSPKEKAIRERRTNQAITNNMMGPTGMLGVIVKTFGHPIMREGSSMYDINYLDEDADMIDTEYETTLSGQAGPVVFRDEIPESTFGAGVADEDNPNFIGYTFDGLNRGMHIEIQFMRYENSLVVYYKGYKVYHETAGELDVYAPFPEWEDMIQKLYKSAKPKQKEQKEQSFKEASQEIARKHQSIWQALRMRWGI